MTDTPLAKLRMVCPSCGAFMNETIARPLEADKATVIMTVIDKSGRRAVIRHDIPMELWTSADDVAAGLMLMRDLKSAHEALRVQVPPPAVEP